ncbi:proline--tRNA ligase [Paenibacillus sp. Leaf72]|uniref:proline--tRNA ligase n=1 Tax=Paenibacillus sp. Leaf72 TaxID=1736234 RepID=UPI0006F94D83|nr:proline--tRNA ligase [Paenibacillus sp. Leaf72]KQO12418.1 proline--tRNA ligase [Paenibacillus sp. Leaf72]
MRQSQLLLHTLRDSPADAEVMSHQLMLRAGYIRQLAAGIYTYLPLGRRVLRKVETIVREEMDREEAQELLMPAMQPADLWQKSGRYTAYGPELTRLKDRHEREFVLGPTHEEVITSLVSNEISSYRRLPVTLYQIQTKFRDERRPRFGLLRSREFLMKDAYSFDTDWEGLDASYWKMYRAYERIFNRCGVNFRAVEADAGAIGGEGGTHEFMALADIGEDTIAVCDSCAYAANLEKAESAAASFEAKREAETTNSEQPVEKFHTPNMKTIDELVQQLDVKAADIIKTLICLVDDRLVAVLIRGDHEMNDIKVKNALDAENAAIADADTIQRLTGAPVGFIGPIGLDLPLLIDDAVMKMTAAIAGANERDYHHRHIVPARDFAPQHIGDFRSAAEGDGCPRCDEGKLQFFRGIEVGHVFKLGTKYSEKLGAVFLDQAGKSMPMIMGCYGIGVSRMLSAAIEQHHDAAGIVWPLALAPYHVHLIPISVKDETHMKVAQQLYNELQSSGVEVLLDDREERPGIKFKDSDLIGIPLRVVIGKDAEQGKVEFVQRKGNQKELITIEEAGERIRQMVSEK